MDGGDTVVAHGAHSITKPSMIVSHPLPLAMIGLVAIAIVAVGSVLLLSLSSKSKVLHQHRDHRLHMLDASRQLRLPGNNGFINDPKTVELRLG